MSYETPRSSDGTRLCAWCGGPVKQSGVGRAKEYCKQGCRELAYRQRKQQKLIDAAVAAALVSSTDDRSISSTDDRIPAPKSSVDETMSVQVNPVIPAPAVEPDPPAVVPVVHPVSAVEEARREAIEAAAAYKARRRRSSMTASAIPLLPETPTGSGEPASNPWIRAVERAAQVMEQASPSEDQEHVAGESNPPTHGA
ncbi:hypothetical protein AB0D29_38275 [Streptomyces sp. NPDC048424]|uniref:hypothetical protein n=1 Tax=Streptomyces sp. NPDC048424 TaxID=3155265 RepID=UPI00344A7CE8